MMKERNKGIIAMKTFDTGAKRQETTGKGRYDLLSPPAMRRLAQVFEEGAKIYGDRNWEKGMPMKDILNHLLIHIFAYMAGDESEDHLGHAAWNAMALLHFDEIEKMKIDKVTTSGLLKCPLCKAVFEPGELLPYFEHEVQCNRCYGWFNVQQYLYSLKQSKKKYAEQDAYKEKYEKKD